MTGPRKSLIVCAKCGRTRTADEGHALCRECEGCASGSSPERREEGTRWLWVCPDCGRTKLASVRKESGLPWEIDPPYEGWESDKQGQGRTIDESCGYAHHGPADLIEFVPVDSSVARDLAARVEELEGTLRGSAKALSIMHRANAPRADCEEDWAVPASDFADVMRDLEQAYSVARDLADALEGAALGNHNALHLGLFADCIERRCVGSRELITRFRETQGEGRDG